MMTIETNVDHLFPSESVHNCRIDRTCSTQGITAKGMILEGICQFL